MTEHRRMIRALTEDPTILRDALGLSDIWIRSCEYPLDRETNERADLVFQDAYNAWCAEPGTTCFVLELKSDHADHEVLGQLQKAVQILGEEGPRIGHWTHTVGVSIAKEYTASGLRMILDQGFKAFLWSEIEGKVTLRPMIRRGRRKRA